ncbi:GHMP family kinase ATP-binding protein [Actinophytocola sp. KF-1]
MATIAVRRVSRETARLDPAATGFGVGHCFGTFGELLQGALPRPLPHFMVTCPAAAWSTAEFTHLPYATTVRVRPAGKRKSARLATLALRAAGLPGGGELAVYSDLPEGKGMASSSADLVATARAVAAGVGTHFGPAELEGLLRRIEPSDGVMYDQFVDFDHRGVRLRESLGVLPAMRIVSYDQGGQVDTVRFNRRANGYDDDERREYAALLAAARHAIRDGDLATVGAVATRSTELDARRDRHRCLEQLRRVCRDVDALGIACAHSGTVLGILIDDRDRDASAKVDAALAACAALPGDVAVVRTLGPADDWTRPDPGSLEQRRRRQCSTGR